MNNQKRVVSGTVLQLHCRKCGATFPHFLFSGDSDPSTDGLCSASSCNLNEVVITEMSPSEWNKFPETGAFEMERQLARDLSRDDLKVLRLLRVEREKEAAAGVSFHDFMKKYKPPTLVFSCACCSNGESYVTGEKTIEDFQTAGGHIITMGRLVI